MKSALDIETQNLIKDSGFNLRLMRKSKGLRIEDLANKSGLSEKSIRNMEAGKDFLFSSLFSVMRVLKEDEKDMYKIAPVVSPVGLIEEMDYSSLVTILNSKKKRVK